MSDAFEGYQAEADAQAAREQLRRERVSTSAQEFVSNRDALEDAGRHARLEPARLRQAARGTPRRRVLVLAV